MKKLLATRIKKLRGLFQRTFPCALLIRVELFYFLWDFVSVGDMLFRFFEFDRLFTYLYKGFDK